jgi:hypothetical protein
MCGLGEPAYRRRTPPINTPTADVRLRRIVGTPRDPLSGCRRLRRELDHAARDQSPPCWRSLSPAERGAGQDQPEDRAGAGRPEEPDGDPQEHGAPDSRPGVRSALAPATQRHGRTHGLTMVRAPPMKASSSRIMISAEYGVAWHDGRRHPDYADRSPAVPGRRRPDYRKLPNLSSTPKSAARSSAIAPCRSSLDGDDTRTCSP